MTMAAVGLAMSAVSAVASIAQASAEAKAVKANAAAQAQLAGLQAQREAQQLESQALVTRMQATLQTSQAGLTGLEGEFARLQRRDEANSAMKTALERVAAVNASSGSGMVDLGNVPTLEALGTGFEDFQTATEAGDIQRAAKEIQRQTQISGADILGFQADVMDADANYIVEQLNPYQQNVIRQNAANQASVIKSRGFTSAVSSMASGAFKFAQVGGSAKSFGFT